MKILFRLPLLIGVLIASVLLIITWFASMRSIVAAKPTPNFTTPPVRSYGLRWARDGKELEAFLVAYRDLQSRKHLPNSLKQLKNDIVVFTDVTVDRGNYHITFLQKPVNPAKPLPIDMEYVIDKTTLSIKEGQSGN